MYQSCDAFAQHRTVLGSSEEQTERVQNAALHQQWNGIDEYTTDFYKVYSACTLKQQLQRAWLRHILDAGDAGFEAIDRILIYHASHVADAYDEWYVQWAKAVQVR